MEALLRRGLRMPTDVALAGFDGTDLAASPVMGLTTVDQHSEQLGRLSVRTLLKQLAADTFVPTHRVLPTQLLLRRSTEHLIPAFGPPGLDGGDSMAADAVRTPDPVIGRPRR
jgi:DNA-binding LacI/PurR family transcriptional regulator